MIVPHWAAMNGRRRKNATLSDHAAQSEMILARCSPKSKCGPVTVFFRRDLEQVALIIEKLRGHVPHRHYRIDQTGGRRALRIGSWRSCSAWARVSLLHGGSDNRSWNCGVKGPTEGPLISPPRSSPGRLAHGSARRPCDPR